MSTFTKWIRLLLFLLFGIMSLGIFATGTADNVTLYTPYAKISVPPGTTISYNIDVINNTTSLQNVNISVKGLFRTWTYTIKSGGWNIRQLSILPGKKKAISLKVSVPLRVNKGNFHFRVIAGNGFVLPLTVNVSSKGTFKTEFTTTQANMEGDAKSAFAFRTELKNATPDTELYALKTLAPRGWDVTFKVNFKAATSVNIAPNGSSSITVNVKAPEQIEAGTYTIPIMASTSETSASLNLQVVIKGTYGMHLSTPTGLLSSTITAGSSRKIDLLLSNTGSVELDGVRFHASTPEKWSVSFAPKIIQQLGAGDQTHVTATITAYDKAIPGDYVTDITAQTPETSSKASFRISVETPMIWGWVGVLVIIIALGSVYYLFRKYGRR